MIKWLIGAVIVLAALKELMAPAAQVPGTGASQPGTMAPPTTASIPSKQSVPISEPPSGFFRYMGG